jgi:NADH:ubiquinone oxidoreductase subunit 4 (subunit M)
VAPRVHVEDPASGSTILAGVFLKLGYGLLHVFLFWFSLFLVLILFGLF